MKKLIEKVKSWHLNRIFIVFLAGSLLLLSTACGGLGNLASAKTDYGKNDLPVKTQTDQDPQGGINAYNDDPRYDKPSVQAKAKALIDQSKVRDQKYDNVGEYVDNVTDSAAKNIERTKEDFAQGAKERTRALQENFDTATSNAKNAARNAADATQDAAKDVKRNVEDLT